MDPTARGSSETAPTPATNADARLVAIRRWLVRAFPWHAGSVAICNLLLNGINALLGAPWWAFWPLLVTAALLAVHYLIYKTATVDEHWAQERTEEVNLKSYDRSHIEHLKSRYGSDDNARS